MSMTSYRQEPMDVLDVFFACVRDCPEISAVETVEGAYSYEEMEALAYQLAATIQHLTKNPYPQVLVALPSSQRAYAAMLGSLIAGGTFCPVAMTAPEERNASICEDFGPHVVLYENTLPSFLSALPATTPRANVLKPLSAGVSEPGN